MVWRYGVFSLGQTDRQPRRGDELYEPPAAAAARRYGNYRGCSCGSFRTRPLFLKGRSRDVNKATRENGARTRTTRTSQNQPTDLRTEALPSCETEARAPACLYHVRMHARFAPLPLSVKRFRSGRSFVTTWRRARSLASLRVDLASRPAEIASLR